MMVFTNAEKSKSEAEMEQPPAEHKMLNFAPSGIPNATLQAAAMFPKVQVIVMCS
jgi:hypothetical protein